MRVCSCMRVCMRVCACACMFVRVSVFVRVCLDGLRSTWSLFLTDKTCFISLGSRLSQTIWQSMIYVCRSPYHLVQYLISSNPVHMESSCCVSCFGYFTTLFEKQSETCARSYLKHIVLHRDKSKWDLYSFITLNHNLYNYNVKEITAEKHFN